MSELAETAKTVGELLPVLVNKKGDIIDGRHRLQANKNWRRSELDLDDLQTHVARLVVNTTRRIADEDDYNELAEYLQKAESGKEKWQVTSGISIAERINQLTGIRTDTVRIHLASPFKDPIKVKAASASVAELGEGTPIRVPESVVESVQQAVQELKKTVGEHPQQKKEIIRDFKEGLKVATAISQPAPPPPIRPEVKIEPKTDSVYTFIKSIHKWAKDTLVIDEAPTALLSKVVNDMGTEDRRRLKLALNTILRNTAKLQQALEAVTT